MSADPSTSQPPGSGKGSLALSASCIGCASVIVYLSVLLNVVRDSVCVCFDPAGSDGDPEEK